MPFFASNRYIRVVIRTLEVLICTIRGNKGANMSF